MSRRRDSKSTAPSAERVAESHDGVHADVVHGPLQLLVLITAAALSCIWSWRLFTPTEAAALGEQAMVPVVGLMIAAAVELLLFFSRRGNSPQFAISPIWMIGVAAILVGESIATVNLSINQAGDCRAACLVLSEFWAVAAIVISTVRFLNRFPAQIAPFLLMWLGITAAIAVYGIWQHYIGYQQLVDTYLPLKQRLEAATQAGRVDPEILRDFAEMGIPTEPGARLLWEQRLLSSREPLGFFALANSLAGLLLTIACLLFGGVCRLLLRAVSATSAMAAVGIDSGPMRTPRSTAVVGSGMVALMLAEACILFCLLLTKSRTAYAGLLVGGGVLMLWLLWGIRAARSGGASESAASGSPGTVTDATATAATGRQVPVSRTLKGWHIALVSIALVAAGIVAAVVTGGLDRLVLSESGKSLRYRIEYWTGAAMVLRESPSNLLLGVGPGNFRQRYLAHKLPQSSEEIADPHNLVLDLWTTGGLAAFLGLLTIAVAVAIAVFRPRGSAAIECWDGSVHSDQRVRKPDSPGIDFSAWWCGPALTGLMLYTDSSNDEQVLIVGVAAAVVCALVAAAVRGIVGQRIEETISAASSTSAWRMIFAAGWFGLTVHLLGAGGISMPAILGIWWLVSALATRREAEQVTVETSSPQQLSDQQPPPIRPQLDDRPFVPAAFAIGYLVLGVVCWFLSAAPTVAATELIRRGDFALLRANDIPEALRLYEAAANADPLSIVARQKLSSVSMFQAEQVQGTNQLRGVVSRAIEWQLAVVKLDPRSAGAQIGLSDVYDSAAQRIATIDRQQAAEFKRLSAAAAMTATELYPTGIRMIATAVERLTQAGRTAEAAKMAQRAIELQRINTAAGHKDKLLPSMQLDYLERVAKNGESAALPSVAD